MIRIGVKFCGGCDPEYDRFSLTQQLEKIFPGKVDFEPYQGQDIDLLLVVNGCRRACAEIPQVPGSKIWMIADISETKKLIRKVKTPCRRKSF